MSSPWLDVPLADYEAHMGSPEVRQLAALADLFAEALEICRPASVAILGIAGGNGLDRIDANLTHRVVGVDINPSYLDIVRHRYPQIPGLELHCLDLAGELPRLDPVDLVHAALLLEHTGAGRCLDNALALVAPGGHLSLVLQNPSESLQPVTPSACASIQNLKSRFSLISAAGLADALEQRGFSRIHHRTLPLASGKSLWMGVFQRARSAPAP